MSILHRIACATLIAAGLVACGGGGGNSGANNAGSASPAAPANAFTASASVSHAEPLQTINIDLASPADSSANYMLEVDVSGATTFAAADTLTVPGWVDSGRLVMSAPVLEMARASNSAALPASFAVRVRRGSDNAVSNVSVVGYDALSSPAAHRGAASTLLKLSFKALFAESSGVLNTRAAQLKPGRLADATASLAGDISIADIQAEAMLRQVFGFSTIDKPLQTQSTRAVTQSAVRIQSESGFADIKAGYQIMWDCLSNAIVAFDGAYGGAAADSCFDTSRQAIRDHVIKGLADLNSKVATVANMTVSLAGLSEGFAGRYVERMIHSSEVTEFVVDLSQMALTSPSLGATAEETTDFLQGKLTDKAKKALYGSLTDALTPIGRGALAIVDAEDALGDVVDLGVEQLQALNGLGDGLVGLASDGQRMQDLSDQFGGPAAGSSGQIELGPFGNVAVATSDTAPTSASICAQNPSLDGAVQGVGFASCESFVQPFLDPVYAKTTLAPIEAQLSSFDINALSACVSTPEDANCQALAAQASALNNQLISALRAYEEKTYDCDGGYAKYENSAGGLTCVYSSLAYTPPGGACFAGSNAAGFDVGDADVCMYYSRDYIQPDGGCRTHYAKVDFQDSQTCRWADLPANAPAAYAINTDSGDRVTLVP